MKPPSAGMTGIKAQQVGSIEDDESIDGVSRADGSCLSEMSVLV